MSQKFSQELLQRSPQPGLTYQGQHDQQQRDRHGGYHNRVNIQNKFLF